MQHYNDFPSSKELGASPAELVFNPELDRDFSFAEHDGTPELRLWEDGFSVL
jgi:hypothetical protein